MVMHTRVRHEWYMMGNSIYQCRNCGLETTDVAQLSKLDDTVRCDWFEAVTNTYENSEYEAAIISILRNALKPFADLCKWLEDEQEIIGDEIYGTADTDIILTDNRHTPIDTITAAMIRNARKALKL